MTEFVETSNLPFCPGCGHRVAVINTEKALERIGLNPLDVILVTDIGCHGIVDKNFHTHTIHGLHGRSPALAAGVAAALRNPDKKVIVYMGDGGATIGLQHLVEAAHRNFNMTVFVLNNMLYGMTGGQGSGLTPKCYKTMTYPEGHPQAGYDLVELIHAARAPYARRLIGRGDYSDIVEEALKINGFALLEIVELCPSYGLKFNRGKRLDYFLEISGIEEKLLTHENRQPFTLSERETAPLLSDKLAIEVEFSSDFKGTKRIVASGSAGEGVQSAGEIFATAAITSGLHATKKGAYPVTVGVGFSTAEVIVSDSEILYTGIVVPDVAIITSVDGLGHSLSRIQKMTEDGILIIDDSLDVPETRAKVIRHPFRKETGGRTAALRALAFYNSKVERLFPEEALLQTLRKSKLAGKVKESVLKFD